MRITKSKESHTIFLSDKVIGFVFHLSINLAILPEMQARLKGSRILSFDSELYIRYKCKEWGSFYDEGTAETRGNLETL